MNKFITKYYLLIFLLTLLNGMILAQADPADAKEGGTFPVGTL